MLLIYITFAFLISKCKRTKLFLPLFFHFSYQLFFLFLMYLSNHPCEWMYISIILNNCWTLHLVCIFLIKLEVGNLLYLIHSKWVDCSLFCPLSLAIVPQSRILRDLYKCDLWYIMIIGKFHIAVCKCCFHFPLVITMPLSNYYKFSLMTIGLDWHKRSICNN